MKGGEPPYEDLKVPGSIPGFGTRMCGIITPPHSFRFGSSGNKTWTRPVAEGLASARRFAGTHFISPRLGLLRSLTQYRVVPSPGGLDPGCRRTLSLSFPSGRSPRGSHPPTRGLPVVSLCVDQTSLVLLAPASLCPYLPNPQQKCPTSTFALHQPPSSRALRRRRLGCCDTLPRPKVPGGTTL